jgi:ACDE family multidrug resistance protein
MANNKNNYKKIYLDKNLQIVFGVTLMAILGVSSLTPAFPEIGMALGLGSSAPELGLLITSFTLPGVIMSPILGILADRYGRKRILVPSLFLFGIAGFSCSFFPNLQILIILRFFQGIGAASLGVLNITIIGDLFPSENRINAMGYNASVLNIGTGSWPLIGGLLGGLAWFAPFLLPILAIPIGLLVLFSLDNPEPKNDQKIKEYFGDAWKIIRRPKVIILFIAGILTFFIIYGVWIANVPFFLNDNFGLDSLFRGIILSFASFIGAGVSSQVGKISKRINEWFLLVFGYGFFALGSFLIPFTSSSIWLFSAPVIFIGFGIGLNVPVIQTILAGEATIKERGAILSIFGMTLRLGQTLGPLIMLLISGIFGFISIFFAGAIFGVLTIGILLLKTK